MSHSAACSGCVAAPEPPPARVKAIGETERYQFALPTVHCAACITTVERGLNALPDVASARVNLGRKRVTIDAAPGLEPALKARLETLGFEANVLNGALLERSTDPEGRALLARIAVAGFAAMNVMLLSVAVWSGAEAATRDLLHWVSALIALPAVAFAALPFFRNAWSALSRRRLNMDVPISLAILLATGVSLSELFRSGAHAYFDAAITLTFFLLIGRYLDHVTRRAARDAASELAALEVLRADRITATGTESVLVEALAPGDLVAIGPGQPVPVDGVVTQGAGEVDTAILTGETLPRPVSEGTLLHAGMRLVAGSLTLRTEGIAGNTLLARIGEMVAQAERARNRYTDLADRAAAIYAPLVHLLAAGAFLSWGLGSGDWRLATNIAAAVLIITCPCALGLAVPAVLAAANGRLFRSHVLLKDGTALERLAGIDTVIFDKTGTLTTGRIRLIAPELSDNDLRVAAALAQGSSHPMARAVREQAAGLDLPELQDLTETAGAGVAARLDGVPVRLGRGDWVGVRGDDDHSTSWLKIGDADPRPLRFEDTPRPDAAATVAALRAEGLDIRLLSGDATGPVARLAVELGIEAWASGVTPEDKVARIETLKAEGRRMLMVGDGLNDTAALAAADVSISPASAIEASRASADMIVTDGALIHVAEAYGTARQAKRRMLENFGISAAYNLVAIPMALAGLATPLMAALAMSASSVTVSLNAMRLRRGG